MASSTRTSTTRSGSVAKKSVAKKSVAKKPAAKKSAAKKPTAKKSVAKKPVAKKPTAKKPTAKKPTAKKPVAKRAPAKKTAAKKPAAAKTAAHYTKPALRERLKDEIMAGTKGGRAGQWSARKAQLLAHAYEEAGGGYKGGRDERQRHLSQWTEQEWTTADGAKAERADGMHRYLPKKAWDELSAAQKRATDRKKVAGSRKGEQFVANTGTARRARRSAS